MGGTISDQLMTVFTGIGRTNLLEHFSIAVAIRLDNECGSNGTGINLLYVESDLHPAPNPTPVLPHRRLKNIFSILVQGMKYPGLAHKSTPAHTYLKVHPKVALVSYCVIRAH